MHHLLPTTSVLTAILLGTTVVGDDAFTADATAMADARIVRAQVKTHQQLHDLLDAGMNPLACQIGVGEGDWVVTTDQWSQLKSSGVTFEVVVDDVQALIEYENQLRQEARESIAAGGSWYSDFRTWPEVNTRLEMFADTSELATLQTIGTTHEGRTIYGISISTDPDAGRPAVIFNGCQHAREWVAVMVPMYIAEQLIEQYGTDSEITALLDVMDVHVIPIVNPDGYEYTYASGGNRYWRKNRRAGSCAGVDLNRNWVTDWNGGESTSTNPCSDIYVGPGSLSEPESSSVYEFITDHPQIKGHIDFHSYAYLILEPWAYTSTPPPDFDRTHELGTQMSNAIQDVHGEYYENCNGGTCLYLASGVMPDTIYGETGAFGYTIELRGNDFVLPPSQILPTCEENLAAALAMMTYMSKPVDFSYPDGLPGLLSPEEATDVDVVISTFTEDPDSSTATVHYELGSGWESSSMTHLSGDNYRASIPAASCDHDPHFYFSVETTSGNTGQDPLGGEDSAYTAGVGEETVLFEDDFNTDMGWTVTNDSSLTDGQWSRGTPVGGGDRGDPAGTPSGSGGAYLTDNVDGNSDVDGGCTFLTSPTMNNSSGGNTLRYWRWYSNNFGADPNNDTFRVYGSDDDGGSWVLLEEVGPGGSEAGGGWNHVQIELDSVSGLSPTSTFRVRFDACDEGDGSVVEAAVDDVVLGSIECDPGEDPCPEDIVGDDGIVGVPDLLYVLDKWGTDDAVADINGDGAVDVVDLLALLSAWGPCP